MKNEVRLSLFIIVALKALFLLTHHIQEDAFITWRVAQNILDYGVIGFNGDIRISASTTHLYTFVSYIFNLILGKEHFMYPLLIFNSLMFTWGSYLFLRVFFKKSNPIILGMFFINFLPPAIKISILGMEYGLMFFFYTAFLFYGLIKRRKWAYWLFPFLLLWTRLDAALFLGIFFIFDGIKYKRWNFTLMFAGILALASVLSFNYFYFGELLNNTIIAKSIAYPYEFKLKLINLYLPNYLGIVKVPESIISINYVTYIVLLIEILAYIYVLLKSELKNTIVLSLVFTFAWVKQLVFIGRLSLFDWYYWTPQIFLFSTLILLL